MVRFFLSLICFVFIPFAVHAETVLFFAPTRVVLSDEKPVQEIRITNMSSIARAYRISLEDLMMSEDGNIDRVDNFEFSAKRMLRFVPRKFEVQPGERQVIRVMARYPKGTEDGDYHAHLEFLEDVSKRLELNKIDENDPKARARMQAQISYMTAIPVVLSKGKVSSVIEMSDLRLEKNEGGQASLFFSLLRSGNGQGNALIEADLLTPDGRMKKAASRRFVPVYRELDKRNHSFVLEQLKPEDFVSGSKIKITLFDQRVSETEAIKTYEVSIP